ncbi:MAG: NAAT family transporter [Rhodospirillales bacterium]|nr:NAAT family transporter [Rhodospirillales bacterium]
MLQTISFHLIALLLIIDPVGVAAMFAALTQGTTDAYKHRMARRAIVIAGMTLLVFTVAGDLVLQALGIGIPAFRIAGGALLFLIAIDMVFARQFGLRDLSQTETREADERDDISVFPMAIPLIAGPGALTTMVLLMGRAGDSVAAQASLIGVLFVVLAITLALLLIAGRVVKLLGTTGVNVISRILGILLAALAIQLVLDGLQTGLKFG